MDIGSSRGFKALMACVYALHCSYFVALIVRKIDTFDATVITNRIKSGICDITHDWVCGACQCGYPTAAPDPLLDYSGVSFFDQGVSDDVVLVRTTSTPNGTEIEDISNVAYATKGLLDICESTRKKKLHALDVPNHLEVAGIIDVCQVLVANIERLAAFNGIGEGSDDRWGQVHALLSNREVIKGIPAMSMAVKMWNSDVAKHNESIAHISAVISSYLSHIEELKNSVKRKKRITTVDILTNPAPLLFVAENAFPKNVAPGCIGEPDTVMRIFSTFPEAASILVYAIHNKIVMPPAIDIQDVREQLRLLALLIAHLQVLVTTSYDSVGTITQIVSKRGIDPTLSFPLEPFWESFVTGKNSRVYLSNVLQRASKARISDVFHQSMEYNIILASRVVVHLATDEEGAFDLSIRGQRQLVKQVERVMVQMSKFIAIDTDRNGYITIEEFVASALGDAQAAKDFEDHVQNRMERQSAIFAYYDFDFRHGRPRMLKRKGRKQLEKINPIYNEILDTFLILDVDASGEISLEEYLESPNTGYN